MGRCFRHLQQCQLEGGNQRKRGKGVRISEKESTPVWKNWQQFLQVDENKLELFHLLAQDLLKYHTVQSFEGLVVATYRTEVVTSVRSVATTRKRIPVFFSMSETLLLVVIGKLPY